MTGRVHGLEAAVHPDPRQTLQRLWELPERGRHAERATERMLQDDPVQQTPSVIRQVCRAVECDIDVVSQDAAVGAG